MGIRSKGREIVLQAMYASRLSGANLTHCLEQQLEHFERGDETAVFARELARKVSNHQGGLEEDIAPLLANWDIERVGVLERLILVLGLVELRYSPEVPPAVAIDEACELARRFCDPKAVGFVNGVLDRLAKQQLP